MVRLKAGEHCEVYVDDIISIPYGAIKRLSLQLL